MLFLLEINVQAQKLSISYRANFGINFSYMDPRTTLIMDYLNRPNLRNLTLTTWNEPDFGYNAGIFIRIQPINSRLNFESGILFGKYENSYKIAVNWEEYSFRNASWEPFEEKIKKNNEFSIISIPFILGYDLNQNVDKKITIFCGVSPNLNMKVNDTGIIQQLEEMPLYKKFFLSYQTGMSMDFNKIECNIKYERSLNITNTKTNDYFQIPIEMKKIYANFIRLSIGFKLN